MNADNLNKATEDLIKIIESLGDEPRALSIRSTDDSDEEEGVEREQLKV